MYKADYAWLLGKLGLIFVISRCPVYHLSFSKPSVELTETHLAFSKEIGRFGNNNETTSAQVSVKPHNTLQHYISYAKAMLGIMLEYGEAIFSFPS